MKKQMFLTALAAITLASCVNPETLAVADRALTIAERRGVITGADAADARDLGSLLVKPPVPAPVDLTSTK